MTRWSDDQVGLLRLPSGRTIRGRSLRHPVGPVAPDHALQLSAFRPGPRPWETRWIHWPDLAVPLDRAAAERALHHAWLRSADSRVEVACGGGVGRTGTALACIAVLDGLDPAAALDLVRQRYHRRAVETPWQRRWVVTFAARAGGLDAAG